MPLKTMLTLQVLVICCTINYYWVSADQNHICAKLARGDLTSIRLKSFTQNIDTRHPSSSMLMLESEYLYDIPLRAIAHTFLYLPEEAVHWSEHHLLKSIAGDVTTDNAHLQGLYFFRLSSDNSKLIIPALSNWRSPPLLKIITDKNEFWYELRLLRTKQVVKSVRSGPEWALVVDQVRADVPSKMVTQATGYIINKDLNKTGHFLLYNMAMTTDPPNLQIASNSSKAASTKVTLYHLHQTSSPEEVAIVPSNQISNHQERPLFTSLPVGFRFHGWVYLFDGSTGCVIIIDGMPGSLNHLHGKKRHIFKRKSVPYEDFFSCKRTPFHEDYYPKKKNGSAALDRDRCRTIVGLGTDRAEVAATEGIFGTVGNWIVLGSCALILGVICIIGVVCIGKFCKKKSKIPAIKVKSPMKKKKLSEIHLPTVQTASQSSSSVSSKAVKSSSKMVATDASDQLKNNLNILKPTMTSSTTEPSAFHPFSAREATVRSSELRGKSFQKTSKAVATRRDGGEVSHSPNKPANGELFKAQILPPLKKKKATPSVLDSSKKVTFPTTSSLEARKVQSAPGEVLMYRGGQVAKSTVVKSGDEISWQILSQPAPNEEPKKVQVPKSKSPVFKKTRQPIKIPTPPPPPLPSPSSMQRIDGKVAYVQTEPLLDNSKHPDPVSSAEEGVEVQPQQAAATTPTNQRRLLILDNTSFTEKSDVQRRHLGKGHKVVIKEMSTETEETEDGKGPKG